VAENVAYGLDVRAVGQNEKNARVAEALSVVQMEKYSGRTPNQLSGGQQQRVALARALVINPDVLLLDEPLSNLDARLRLEMREEIRRIHARTKITTIYVTHDQKESLSMADRIAVMREGVIEQIGDPRTVYRSPSNRFVADFIGETNWLNGEVLGSNGAEVSVETQFGRFNARSAKLASGRKVLLGFRPEAVEIGDHQTNALPTTIDHVSYLGDVEQYELRLSPEVTIKSFEQNPLEIRRQGEPLRVHIRPQNLIVLPAD
jgi:iron(III) transport system ATP-binding protein